MSVESRPNKLTKGLVLDTFHTDVDNTVATYALNSQLEDQEGNHFHYGSEVGTTYIRDIPTNHVVVGHINMERNETVLFTTDGTNSTIGILSRKDDMSYNYEIKVDDSKQTKKLGFKKEGYVRGVYRLLNGCDKVIYFVDGVNKDRRININQLDSYKLPTTASVASGIIFDDSLRATIYALSSATGNIQLIRLMSASPEATANVLANLSSGAELTKLLTASANGIGTALANLIRTANIVSSIEATGTSTVNVDIVRLLQSNVSAIGSVNAILEASQQGLVEIDVTLSGVASSTAILLRAALLEVNLTTEATTLANAILTRIINAQVQALANTESSAQISIPVNATVDATATTAANAILSYAINATVDAMAQTSATAQLSKVISASVDALADSSSELLIGLVLVSTNIAGSSASTADLYINRLLSSSVTAEGTTTVEALIAKLLESSTTATANNTTTDLLVSKLLASTVDGLANTTANLQLADLLSTSLSGTATAEALLEAVSSIFSINKGLRFSTARQTYLSRTPTVASSRTTWTYSTWIKRGNLPNTEYIIFGANGVGGVNSNSLRTNADRLILEMYNGSGQDYFILTTSVFRDISSWYHIVAVWDTTNAVELDRIRLYVNGIRITSFTPGNTLVQNTNSIVNSAVIHYIGGNTSYYDGYMAEVNFIDGQALTPTSFGKLDLNLGTWIPKAYTGTYGTNGFRLNFNDVSGITATTLGKDSSVNGNNWTPNNFSVTAGVNYDGMTDSPTNTSDTIGNYATLNPMSNPNTPLYTISNGNLDYSCSASSGSAGRMSITATIPLGVGKYYWEAIPTTTNPSFGILAFRSQGIDVNPASPGTGNYIAVFNAGQNSTITGPVYSGTSFSYSVNDVIGMAFDGVLGELSFYKNGTYIGKYSSIPLTEIWLPGTGVSTGGASTSYSINFGQRPFVYPIPTGFKTLNTFNLPTPTIGATTATQANKFMDVSLYSGTGAAQSIFNSGFKPDLVWIKNRTGTAASHAIYDINRGVTKQLSSDSTGAETTQATGLTSFDTTGFTIGALGQINTSGNNYIAWQWRAGGTPVTNNSGTITSQVSVSQISGFSVVTYTGNGSPNQTVGHGLGIIPSFVIIKDRGAVVSFSNYHKSLGTGSGIDFSTSAPFTAAGFYSGMSSSVIGLGYGGAAINGSGKIFIAYAWAEIDGFSKFNSYVGNGSTDGTFVYTGFRPKFILIKAISTTGNWAMFNSIVNTSNPVINELLANTSAIENTTGTDLDFLSNGFKLRSANADINTSAATYIYAAFGEFPLKYANAALMDSTKYIIVDYLIIGGGGAGGGTATGGGGGAGGYRKFTGQTLFKTSYTVIVGNGGTGTANAGGNGDDSQFIHIVNGGGGGGKGQSGVQALTGGSGGGGGGKPPEVSGVVTAGAGNEGNFTPSEGNNGGAGINIYWYAGGGGGGSSSVGGAASGGLIGAGSGSSIGGAGGGATSDSITGTPVARAAGGGGAAFGTAGAGVSLVSGNGVTSGNGGNGTDFKGGGGGGGHSNGGNGGKGVVIIRWLTSSATITLSNGAQTDAQSYTDGSYSIREIRNSGTVTFS